VKARVLLLAQTRRQKDWEYLQLYPLQSSSLLPPHGWGFLRARVILLNALVVVEVVVGIGMSGRFVVYRG
jgi:hypothetical protein